MSLNSCNNDNSIRRGTTPTNTFNVNIDLREATVFISYAQRGNVLVEKTGSDLIVTKDSIITQLTQLDTLKFKPGELLIQVRYVLESGIADASNIIKTIVTDVLKKGKIDYV